MIAGPGDDGVERFRELIAVRTGLAFPDDHLRRISDVLRRRLQALRLAPEAYLEHLAVGSDEPSQEWDLLTEEITVGETFFFRNADQIQALCEIAGPRAAARGQRSMQILSAGCSSGEEPFSLAMALEERCAHPAGGRTIHAFDINAAAIARARQGLYPAWSLRETSPARRELFFQADGQAFQLVERIRSQVTFEVRNIVLHDPGFWRHRSFDVIFCRNVLMYLQPQVAREVVGRLAEALAPGGFLFLGHAETLRGLSEAFDICSTHGTFYYQLRGPGLRGEARRPETGRTTRVGGSEGSRPVEAPAQGWFAAIGSSADRVASLADAARLAISGSPQSAATDAPVQLPLTEVVELIRQERHGEAGEALIALPQAQRQEPLHTLLLALVHLHLGAALQAEAACRLRLAAAPGDARFLYLFGLLCEQAGELPAAADRYLEACTADPTFALAHLRRGLLLRRAQARQQAIAAFTAAAALIAGEDELHLALFAGGFSRQAITDLLQRLSAEVPDGR